MKKQILLTILAIGLGTVSMNSIEPSDSNLNFNIQKTYAVTLGYDKSMSEKTIKAAVIDSYYRKIAQTGNIIRWNKSSMPLKVYIENSKNVPEYYKEIILNAYQSWQRASEGLVRFEFVKDKNNADLKCEFKLENSDKIASHTFTFSNDKIINSIIVFNKSDSKGQAFDSKQLYSSALHEIGASLGLTANSPSIYDVMYPIGTKFNTEITSRDLKTLALLYSTIPNITDNELSQAEKSKLMTVNEILSTLNVPVNDNTNLEEVTGGDVATHLALAEQYRKKAQYSKAAKEYQIVAQMKADRRSKSEVYYEVAVMYLDAEEFENAKNCADVAWATDENDLTITLPPLINYYKKCSNTAVDQLEEILTDNPYNKHAYKLLCQIYREKHHEYKLHSTIKRYGKTAGVIE